MKILAKINQLVNKRCSSANGLSTSSVGAVTSLILMVILGPAGAIPVSATSSTLTVSIADGIALDLIPTSANGTFMTSDTSNATVSVRTDNYTGYTLGIAASSLNSTDLTYTEDGSTIDTIPSISSSVSANNYANDSYATSNNLNNTWGFRPSKYNSIDNTDYLPIPADTTSTTLDTTSAPNASTANTYNIAIGARIDLAKTPGSYTNTFVITVLANATPYTITYNANGGSNPPDDVNSSSYSETEAVSSTEPTKTGYDFIGWCVGTSSASNITTTAGVDNCSTSTIAAGGNITLDQTNSDGNDFYLYAMWSSSKIYIQELTLANCPTVETVVYDRRDENDYTVRKIGDDCWMTQNLRFTGTSLSSSTSNVASTYTDANPYSVTWYDLNTGASSGGACYGYGSNAHDSNGSGWYNLCKHEPTTSDISTLGITAAQIGVWYNYPAASAGTVAGYSNYDDSIYNLCPSGWTLPNQSQISSVGMHKEEFAPVYSGYYNGVEDWSVGSNGSLSGADTYGGWWGSDYAGEMSFRIMLEYGGGALSTDSQAYKYYGFSIRCVAKS